MPLCLSSDQCQFKMARPNPRIDYDVFNVPSNTPQQAANSHGRPESAAISSLAVSPNLPNYSPSAESLSTTNPAPDSASTESTNQHEVSVSPSPGPSRPAHKSSGSNEGKTLLFAPKIKKAILLSWWREIAAAVLSTTSMVLVLLIILKINNTALESWNFHIGSLSVQPNTVIAVLTVIGQTLMMVPVASALGQLKWAHFNRPRCLHHMQLIDDASRGPWGSLLLLLHVASTRSLEGSLLGLVTIVALGIGPSAQQILDFRDAPVLLQNVTAEIGLATNYSSKSYVSQFGSGSGRAYFTSTYNSDVFRLQSSLIDGLAGSVFSPNFVCPGDTCTWPDYTSLGVCGHYYNLTDSVEANCTGDDVLLNCIYQLPDSLTDTGSNETMEVTFADQESALSFPTTIFQSKSVIDLRGSLGLFSVKVQHPGGNPVQDYSPPVTEISYSNWTWCAKTFINDTGTPAAIRSGEVASESLVQSGFVTNEHGDSGSGSVVFTTNSGLNFYVDHNTQIQLFTWLGTFLERTIIDRYPHTGTQRDDDNFNLGFFLYASDLRVVTEDLADTLTNQIRSTTPGDNLNSTTLTGEVYVNQTYISVRWQWIILPLAETLLTSFLLAYCIISTRSGPLLKSSVLALFFHPLEGLTEEELNMAEHKTSSELETQSKTVMAKVEGGQDGRFRFYRVR